MSRPESDAPDADEWTDYYKQLLNLRTTQIVPRLDGATSINSEAIGNLAVKASWRLGDGTVLTIAANFAETPVRTAFPPEQPLFGGLEGGELPPSSTIVWLVT
jgi:maltooligosyltrehalose trehalohydrolase